MTLSLISACVGWCLTVPLLIVVITGSPPRPHVPSFHADEDSLYFHRVTKLFSKISFFSVRVFFKPNRSWIFRDIHCYFSHVVHEYFFDCSDLNFINP